MEDLRSVLDAVGLGELRAARLSRRLLHVDPVRGDVPRAHPGARGVPPVLFSPIVSPRERSTLGGSSPRLRDNWGTAGVQRLDARARSARPSSRGTRTDRNWFANWLRVGASPQVAYALNRAWLESDIRDVTPALRVPTLVLYRPVDLLRAVQPRHRSPDPGRAGAARVRHRRVGGSSCRRRSPRRWERFVAGEGGPRSSRTRCWQRCSPRTSSGRPSARPRSATGEWRELLQRHHAARAT